MSEKAQSSQTQTKQSDRKIASSYVLEPDLTHGVTSVSQIAEVQAYRLGEPRLTFSY